MEDSIFTKIIKGEIPCHKIYEDENTIAFLDVHPQTEGHTLVVPKRQIEDIWDMDADDYEVLWSVVYKLGPHIRDVIGSKRVGVVVAGFGVPHVHVHLIPINREAELKQAQDLESDIDHDSLAEVAKRLYVEH